MCLCVLEARIDSVPLTSNMCKLFVQNITMLKRIEELSLLLSKSNKSSNWTLVLPVLCLIDQSIELCGSTVY